MTTKCSTSGGSGGGGGGGGSSSGFFSINSWELGAMLVRVIFPASSLLKTDLDHQVIKCWEFLCCWRYLL